MTDYAQPVSAAEVCERIEKSLAYRANQLRAQAATLIHQAEAIELVVGDVFKERQTYERYQTKCVVCGDEMVRMEGGMYECRSDHK